MVVGIEDMTDIHKWRLLMIRANLDDQDKRIPIAAIGNDGLYEKVNHTLINFLDKRKRGRFG